MRITTVVAAVFIAFTLAACTPAAPGDTKPSESAKPVEPVTPKPEKTTKAPIAPAGLDADDYANLQASIETGNTAAIEGYLSEPVNFVIAATECCGPVTPFKAVSGLDYVVGAVGPWAAPTAAQLAQYQAGFYVDYFAAGAFVIQSSDADPYVVSFAITGDQVTGIFIGNAATLLSP